MLKSRENSRSKVFSGADRRLSVPQAQGEALEKAINAGKVGTWSFPTHSPVCVYVSVYLSVCVRVHMCMRVSGYVCACVSAFVFGLCTCLVL